MPIQALTLPLDITWHRLAYSRDMVDTDFSSATLSPKWRSSLAVYSYVVPAEQTAESYPDSRIVYLKLSCSITGFNISEELIDPKSIDSDGDELDDLQSSTWEAVQSEGWANQYWGCQGAIVQIAVYPGPDDDVGPDDFPFIQDFEPKKREFFETATEGAEFLSGTSHKVSTLKGTTTIDNTEKSVKASAKAGFGPFGATVEGGLKKTDETSKTDNTTTDASREKRETSSFSSSFSQMYQLFNGYHVGTNRAVFVISPRPHTVSASDSLEFNLIDGQRKLEGLQDMFLVIRVPKTLQGICLQANIDTGHTVETQVGQPLMVVFKDTYDPNDEEQSGDDPDYPDFPPDGDGDGNGDGEGGEPQTYSFLVVTRRSIRNCGTFTDDDRIQSLGASSGTKPGRVVFEAPIAIGQSELTLARRSANTFNMKLAVANQRNRFQRRIRNIMMGGFTADKYKPRPIEETKTFSALARIAAKKNPKVIPEKLVETNILTKEEFKFLTVNEIKRLDLIYKVGEDRFSEAERKLLFSIRSKLNKYLVMPALKKD